MGSDVTWTEIPEEYQKEVEELRAKIVEKAADLDESLQKNS